MVQVPLVGGGDTGRNDPASAITDGEHDEQDSTFSFTDRLKSGLGFVACVSPFEHHAFEYQAGEPKIKAPFFKIVFAFGWVPCKIPGAEASPNPSKIWRH